MKKVLLLMSLMICFGATAQAAELSYQTVTENAGAADADFLIITATEGTESIWQMRINLGRTDGHAYWRPGEIQSFKDLQYNATAGLTPFEYSQEYTTASLNGMMRMSNMDGTFDDAGGQTTGYYEFTKTNTLLTDVVGVLTYRINAPVVAEGGYSTTITATYTITNNSTTAYDLAGGGGAQALELALNGGGYFDWDIVNPIDGVTRPNVHNTDILDGHQLYYIEDWYGDLQDTADHPIIKMVVKQNDLTSALNMRPGMTFVVESPTMDLGYVKRGGSARGTTSATSSTGVYGRTFSSLREPWGDPGMSLAAGESITMQYSGLILAPGTAGEVSAATSEVSVTTPVAADGVTQSVITITIRDASGLPIAGVLAADIVVAVDGSGNTIVQPVADTDANGQTVAYVSSSVAAVKTVTVTVEGVLLNAQPTIQFSSDTAALEYSGADIAAGNGVMTILARNLTNGSVLWEVDLTRSGTNVKVSRFTDGGTFNYAAPAGTGKGMIGLGGASSAGFNGTFTELAKTSSAYSFQMVDTGTTFEHTTVVNIEMPDSEGTVWPMSRTVTNITEAAAKPYGGMGFQLGVNVDEYTPGLVNAELSGTSGMTARKHQVALAETELLYTAYENVDRGATGLLTNEIAQGMVVVNDNEFTQGLGMTAGRTLGLVSDLYPYYPSDAVGDANLYGSTASYLQRLYIQLDPREFMGTARSEHVNLDPGASYTANYAFTADIAAPGGGSQIEPLTVTSSLDYDFTYQNVTATDDRHFVTLTLAVGDTNGNTSYNVSVVQSGGDGSLFEVRDTANPLVKELVGSRRTDGVAGAGLVELAITVTGVEVGGTGEAVQSLTVRRLGDINADGFVTPTDKGVLNASLNGLAVEASARDLDVNGDGSVAPTDKGLLNAILNGVVQP